MSHARITRFFVPLLLALGIALFGAIAGAQASPPLQEGTPTPPPEGAQPDGSPTPVPQSCAECHLDVVSAWETGMHAQAYIDPVFQEAWQNNGNDPTCLACHTTGFNARTGAYDHEGVTCEACHGETPPTHPDEPVMINPGPEVCEDCHATTVTEWEQSAHGEQQLACTVCHDPHPQQLRFENDSVALCINCHEEPRDDYAHLVHAENDCVACHWHRASAEDLLAHYETGALFPTGHTAEVETKACVACHAEIALEEGTLTDISGAAETLGVSDSPHPLLAAEVRIQELEARVETVQAQGENSNTLRLIQGLVVGVAFGGLAIFLVQRVRGRRSHFLDEQE